MSESVEEFLRRGGRINRLPIRKTKPKKLAHGEALRKRLKRERLNVGLE